MKPRESYGVILRGVSGAETITVDTRATANRIRRSIRAWRGWTGWHTLTALAQYAADHPGIPAKTIIEDFRSKWGIYK